MPERIPMKSPDGSRIRWFPAHAVAVRERKGWAKVPTNKPTPAVENKEK